MAGVAAEGSGVSHPNPHQHGRRRVRSTRGAKPTPQDPALAPPPHPPPPRALTDRAAQSTVHRAVALAVGVVDAEARGVAAALALDVEGGRRGVTTHTELGARRRMQWAHEGGTKSPSQSCGGSRRIARDAPGSGGCTGRSRSRRPRACVRWGRTRSCDGGARGRAGGVTCRVDERRCCVVARACVDPLNRRRR